MGVYRIQNKITGRVYIGCTKAGFYKRLVNHISRLRYGTHECKEMQNDWNIVGEENFIVEVVEYVDDPSRLLEIEKYWQDKFNGNLYNFWLRKK